MLDSSEKIYLELTDKLIKSEESRVYFLNIQFDKYNKIRDELETTLYKFLEVSDIMNLLLN